MANTRKSTIDRFVLELYRSRPKELELFSEIFGNSKEFGLLSSILPNVFSDISKEAMLYSPSIIEKTVYWNTKNNKGITSSDYSFSDYSKDNPISAIWKLAWPSSSKEVFRGWADIIPFQAVNALFYGITMLAEATFRGLGSLLLKPLNYAFKGKDNLLIRVLFGLFVGIPLGLIGQIGIFFANTLKHARFVVDSALNFIPSLISFGIGLFSEKHGKYDKKFPQVSTCLSSFFKNLPFLLLDLLLIAACLVPGGQVASFLGSIGGTAAGSIFSPMIEALVVPIGKSLGIFLSATVDWFIGIGLGAIGGYIAGSALFGTVVSFTQNIFTSIASIFKRPSDLLILPLIKEIPFVQAEIKRQEDQFIRKFGRCSSVVIKQSLGSNIQNERSAEENIQDKDFDNANIDDELNAQGNEQDPDGLLDQLKDDPTKKQVSVSPEEDEDEDQDEDQYKSELDSETEESSSSPSRKSLK